MTEALVEVLEVTKSYGALRAVDGVSLKVHAGEVYALVGANGAGKSTLIRTIVGIIRPDAGRITVCGHSIERGVEAKRMMGYLPEELTLYERLTGREYLELVAGLKRADAEQIEEAIDFAELREVAGKWVGGYSLGMRKKLGLASALIGSPPVLVLDEPLNGLDVEMMRKLRRRIREERDLGRVVLLSSHVMDFVERVADRVGVMSGGKIVAEGAPRALRQKAGLSDAPFEDVFFELARADDN